ncbi:MAG TPA: LysE family transporter, partial [Spirochaetia bacterium]|nr:LysE family transporter [Spirochaetia bacterium]
ARLILKRPSLLDSDSQTRSSQSSLSYLIRGFLVNSTNPKALLFYAALFPPFLSANAPLIPQLSILAATFLGIFIVVGVLHALLGSRAGLILQNGRRMNLENKISGAVMIGAAVWIATK